MTAMKIFAAGIATETNTFSPVPTSLEDFVVERAADRKSGGSDKPLLDLSSLWEQQAQARGDTILFGLVAWAQPSGTTVRSAYESLRDEMLSDLRAVLPVDVVLLNLHGAMIAEGYDDCEEDMIGRVRALVGPDAVIGVALDLHCHLSHSKLAAADIAITYKEYPHTDVNDRAREVFDLAIATKLGRIRPVTALFDCRMVGLYATTREPMQGFVLAMSDAERRAGVLSVSFGHGFQYADVPYMGAKLLAITDGDRALAEQVAEELGAKVHELRRDIGFESLSLPLHEALSDALASRGTPVVVADQSDNTGGGAPGDATFALRWLLDRDVGGVATAILYDPEVVRIARRAGAGARLPVRLGGKLGPASGRPLDIEVTVLSAIDNYMHAFPQSSGEPWLFPAGDVVALRCRGIDIVVSSVRCQCFSPAIFTDLGIDPASKRLLIPKSLQHFHGAFAPIAKEVIYMAAPGAVPPDPRLISYRRVDTARLYPWIEEPMRVQR